MPTTGKVSEQTAGSALRPASAAGQMHNIYKQLAAPEIISAPYRAAPSTYRIDITSGATTVSYHYPERHALMAIGMAVLRHQSEHPHDAIDSLVVFVAEDDE